MKKFGLIGKNIAYSKSKELFDSKQFEDAEYKLYDINEENITREFLQQFDGLNVTIPYKKAVVKYLDEICLQRDDIEFNAINCIVNVDGKLKGYNTDLIGIKNSIKDYLDRDKKILICGNGGAAEAIQYFLHKNKFKYIILSREAYEPISKYGINYTYDEFNNRNNYDDINIVINATPVGTINNPGVIDIPFEKLVWVDLAFDLVYNPEETEFLKRFKKQGAMTKNGKQMLIDQAEASYKLWMLLEL